MKSFKFCLIFFLLFNYASAQDYQAYQIFTKEGKKTSFSKLKSAALKKRFVFFGELHDDPIAHWLQFELQMTLFEKHHENLVCGSEMYEQDNQNAINSYLTGEYDLKKFKDSCRLWSNQETDYQHMLDFAKENKLKWIATNIPRKFASQVYKKGVSSLANLTDLEKTWLAPIDFPVDTTLSQYAALLNSEMHMGNNFVYAQAIKDATMGYFISKNIGKDSVFYHLNGSYHSDFHQGILWYLNYYGKIPYEEMLTISTVTQADISKLEKDYLGKADFIICVPETMTRTH
jgi:uncharacterized iron-regulated protein